MNNNLDLLQSYPFQKLTQLLSVVTYPNALPAIKLSIGEPSHPAPDFIAKTWLEHQHELSQYPTTQGNLALRLAIANWLINRFNLPSNAINPECHCLPVAGTREALFAFAQSVITPNSNALVLMPNPFYQIYEGAALLAGAQPWFLNTTAANNFLPDLHSVPEAIWQRCQLIYVCSPGNPTGAVVDIDTYSYLISLADRYNFVIAADECYSEIYSNNTAPPVGLLQVCAQLGRLDFNRCVVFHSLSKRSNVPGLRSGFVAGDAQILEKFFLYRTYQGCALPLPTQAASTIAWSDEKHVVENRVTYQKKFDAVLAMLGDTLEVYQPPGGFYLWTQVPTNGEDFARKLYAQKNVTVLPGSYLSRNANGIDPGVNYVRIALVANIEQCLEASQRIKDFIKFSS